MKIMAVTHPAPQSNSGSPRPQVFFDAHDDMMRPLVRDMLAAMRSHDEPDKDVKLVAAGGNELYASSFVLRTRSKMLRMVLDSGGSESRRRETPMPLFDSEVRAWGGSGAYASKDHFALRLCCVT